jgi:hypothetical protein
MAVRKKAVYATYRTHTDLEEAVGVLIIKGFPSETISALIPEELSEKTRTLEPVPVDDRSNLATKEILRGTLGLLDHPGAISIPRHGMFIGAGPLLSELAGVESGSVAAVLERFGAARSDAKRCEQSLDSRALVFVQCADSDCVGRARQVLTSTAAEHLSSTSKGAEVLKVRHGGAPST